MATVNVFEIRPSDFFFILIIFFKTFSEFEIKIRTITIFPQNSIIKVRIPTYYPIHEKTLRILLFFSQINIYFSRILTFPQDSECFSEFRNDFFLRIIKLKSEFLLFFREFPQKISESWLPKTTLFLNFLVRSQKNIKCGPNPLPYILDLLIWVSVKHLSDLF